MRKIKLFLIMSSLLVSECLLAQVKQNTFSYKTNNYKIILLSEGQQIGNSGILIDASAEILGKYTDEGKFPNATNAFLIKTDNKNILIDTGYGRNLFDNIDKYSIKPEEIDIILITHMHGDHIGGMLKNGKKSFPNADLYISQKEYDYWTDKNITAQQPDNRKSGFINAQKVVEIYRDKLHLFTPNEIDESPLQIVDGINAVAAYGHTPGHTIYIIGSDNEQILVWGDLTHAMAVQMPHPEIAVTYDVNPAQAILSREKILEYVSANNIPIAGMHISYPAIGKIISDGNNGYKFIQAQ